MLCLGLINNNTHAIEVFASSRAYLYIIIFFFFGYSRFNINLNKLFYIAVGSILGGYFNGVLLSPTLENIHSYSNIITYAILVSYPLIKKRYFLFIICLFGALYISFYSGLRRQIVEVFLSFAFTYFLILLRDNVKINKLFILIFIILPFLVTKFIFYIEDYFLKNNIYLWRRIFLKTQHLEDSIASEGSRIEHPYNLINYISDTIIPKGIYPRGVSFNVANSVGSTLDFPLYEIFYVFGSLTAIVFILFFIKGIFRCVKLIFIGNKNEDEIIMICSISILLIFACFFDGSFLQYTFVTPFTGFVLGRLFFFKKKVFNASSS